MESENHFKLVLTDINMPEMDGWQLAHKIKSLYPLIPIIALSGEDPNMLLIRIQGSGIRHVLFKPFRIDDLNAALAMIFKPK